MSEFKAFYNNYNFGNSQFPNNIMGNMVFDEDALKFIKIVGITKPNQQYALNQLCYELKIAGFWDKFIALYPVIGGTAATHKWNLKNISDTDAAFRLTFTGGWTHDDNQMKPNGTNAYANTYIYPSASLSLTDNHISAYTREQFDFALNYTNIEIGCSWLTGSADIVGLIIGRNTGSNFSSYNFGSLAAGTVTSITTNLTTSFFIGNTLGNSASARSFQRNGYFGTNSTAYGTPTLPQKYMFLGAFNNEGGSSLNPQFYSSRPFSFASIGFGFNEVQSQILYNIVNRYQANLGRSIN